MITPQEIQLSPEYAQRRFGRFKITDELIKSHSGDLKKLFGEMIITKCEHNFYGYFEYHALSMLFDPVPEAVEMPEYEIEVPEYEIEVTRKKNGSLSFAARKP